MNKFHRYMSFFLCLALIIFCLPPIRAHAYVVDPYSAAYIVVGDIVVEGVSEGAKVIASALASVWNKVFTPELLQTAQGVLEIGSFFTDSIGHKAVFDSYSEGELSAGQVVLTKAFISSVVAAYETKTGQTLSTVEEDVTIYVPPESVWSEADLITAYRLNVQGFADLTEVNKNILAGNQITWQLKKDINGLELYLRTTFVETLDAEFADLSSAISSLKSTIGSMNANLASKVDTLDVSISALSSTLHKDIVDLKTLYSTFGNETLSKLDTLNTSIQSIESYNSSKDFSDLKSLYSQFGNETLAKLGVLNDSIELLPDQISQSLFDFYEIQSLHLEDISNKLGTFEESFLETMTGDLQLIRDEVSAGFADVIVALDQIDINVDDITVDIDLQPVVDQILESEVNLNMSLSSIYDVVDSLDDSLQEYFSQISELYLDEYTSTVIWGVTEIANSLENVLSDTSQLVEVSVKVDDFLTSDFYDISFDHLTTLTSTVDGWGFDISNQLSTLYPDFSAALLDIKTAVQSIAGTITAPFTLDTSAMDEADDLKIPLIPHINNGFGIGGEYFGSVQTFLGDDLNGFLVAGMIFEEFAGMSFFYKLIITSCSIGLIGTLLGMALNVTSYSVAQRRREEAAQARSHIRMERSVAA